MPLRDLRVSTGAVVALAWMLSAAVSAAQTRPDATTTGGSARVSLLKGGEMGELLTVYVPRNESEVQRLLADSRDTEASMEGAVERTQKLVIEADGRARIMKEELEATRVRRDVARKLKDAAAMAQLESAFQRQDREHSYLEDLREALRADIDRIETERQAAASRTKALELEMRVVQRHRVLTSPNRSASGSGSGTQPAAAAVRTPTPEELAHYRGLLRDMLDAQRDAAGRWATAAERRRVLAERKIKQLEALTRLTAPKSSGR